MIKAGRIGAFLFGTFAVSFAGRIALKAMKKVEAEEASMGLRGLIFKYPGGFEENMSRREAALILDVK